MRAESGGRSALRQVQADLGDVCRALTEVVAGSRGKALIDDLRATVSGTTTEILWQALYADCLRVVHSAVMADGVIEDREIEALYDIIASAARCYTAGVRSQYAEFAVADCDSARAFLDHYAADRGPFGRGARLGWPGLTLCRRAAELGERVALQRYTTAMTSMVAEACRLGGMPSGAGRSRGYTDEIDELRRILASESAATAQTVDRRVQAFLAPCRVFSAVQQASSIFENDPFDVEEVHRDARVSFERLVAHAARRPHISDLGQMLVVLGDSGAGKTHLLRGFRRHVHERGLGFVVYAQLQSRSEDYARYLLKHLVGSLSQRYSEQSGKTGLRELASGLVRLAAPPLRERLERFADDTFDARGTLAEHVEQLVDDLLGIAELGRVDRDLLRVMLYALRPDPRTTSSVYKYLRCEAMSAHELRYIGDVMPRTRDDDPHWMIHDLARLTAATQRALVVMVDQVDLAGFEADSTRIFRRAIDALYRIVSECPSAVAVISCLSDLYDAARGELNRPALDRLEKAPPLAKLQINRSYAEIEAVVARRLSWLFAEHGTVHRPEQPVYPIPESELRQLENRRLRDVLEWCHQFQAQCAAAGKIISADEPIHVPIKKDKELDLDAIAAAWNEAIQAHDLEVPDDEEEILAVVAEAAKAYVYEMELSLSAPPYKNGVLRMQMARGEDRAALAIAVANRNYHGGAFPNQIDSLRRRTRGALPIAVRTLEFPRGRACDKAMGQLVNMRGRGVYLDATTLRSLVAFQRFQPPFPADRISAWKLRDRPIASLPAVIEIFDFDRSRVEPAAGGGRRAAAAREAAEAEFDAPDAEDSGAFASPSATASASTSTSAFASASASASAPALRSPPAAAPVFRGGAVDAADERPTAPAPAAPRAAEPGPGPRRPDVPSGASTFAGVPASTRPEAAGIVWRGAAPEPEPEPDSARPPRTPRSTERAVERALLRPPAVPAKQLWLGNSTGFDAQPILLDLASLLRHVGVVESAGHERTGAALSLVEQALERGVPAIVLDRTGELSGHARADWWQHSQDAPRARRLAEGIDVRLFTPGTRGGRPLSVAIIPDLSRVPRAEHARAVQLAAGSITAMIRAGADADELSRFKVLTQAIGALASQPSPSGLVELIALLESGGDALVRAGGDDRIRSGLIEDLAALLSNADVFTPGAEPLTAATLVGPAAGGRVPLAIINTRFLGDGPRLRAWVAHLIGCVSRELAASTSGTLHTVFVVDGAELFLPLGAGKLPPREPLQELIKRAGAAGLGVVLASQRPEEIDYRRCLPIETWLVGKAEPSALDKMKALFDRCPLGYRNPSRLERGRFVFLHDGGARDVESGSPLLRAAPIGDVELKLLAARTHPRTREASPAQRADPAASRRPSQDPSR